ncbi:MAG: exopolysaccharide biosynthesis protein [Deltaproteobacteria bacterium]|nr:exopolysaccharide biosynthesis protein [Deltaproteobacteria bacterium]
MITHYKNTSQRLSQRLTELVVLIEDKQSQIQLDFLLDLLGERCHALFIFILVIPFLQPIPLPGVSTAFGLAIALLGVQLTLEKKPWLPHWLRKRQLSTERIVKIFAAGKNIFLRFEKVIRPRLQILHAHPIWQRITGIVITIAGLLLAIPLPIPISNFLPALIVALLSIGILEEDGLLIIWGFIAFVFCLAFFVMLVLLPYLGWQYGKDFL